MTGGGAFRRFAKAQFAPSRVCSVRSRLKQARPDWRPEGGTMTIAVKAYANADDVLIAWQPDRWSGDWAGFQLEQRSDTTQQITVVVNRIPPKPGQGPVQ